MISPSDIRVNEYRYQDLLPGVDRNRLADEVRRASPAAPRKIVAGRVHVLARRAIATLAAVHAFRVGRAAEA